jgi:hypothetical protein
MESRRRSESPAWGRPNGIARVGSLKPSPIAPPEGMQMSVGRSVAVRVAALCLLVAPGAVLAQSAPSQAADSHTGYAADRVLTRVVVYGSIGAIVGALGSLRKRGGSDATLDDDGKAGQ